MNFIFRRLVSYENTPSTKVPQAERFVVAVDLSQRERATLSRLVAKAFIEKHFAAKRTSAGLNLNASVLQSLLIEQSRDAFQLLHR